MGFRVIVLLGVFMVGLDFIYTDTPKCPHIMEVDCIINRIICDTLKDCAAGELCCMSACSMIEGEEVKVCTLINATIPVSKVVDKCAKLIATIFNGALNGIV